MVAEEFAGDTPMPDLTHDDIRRLADELEIDEDTRDEIESLLLMSGLRPARVRLLGFIDARVDSGDISTITAAEYYPRLGFSPEEASCIRQSAGSNFQGGRQ